MNYLDGVDLFAGAGGTSTGMMLACEDMGIPLNLTAINHWSVAIATHMQNHPRVRHLCESLDNVNPRDLVPRGRLNLLAASPECTHHSRARGGRPMSDQSRASAHHISRWAEAVYIDNILIENVKEFQDWGPLGIDGRPLKSLRGEAFKSFISTLLSLGYNVEWRVLCAADYGDATTRERLFVLARRAGRKIVWPNPEFGPKTNKKWRAAREIIDWSLEGTSIFNRPRPLKEATLRRIESGLKKFGGAGAEPFIVVLRNHGDARTIDDPLSTITAGGMHFGLAQPCIVKLNHGQNDMRSYSVDQPLPTVTSADTWGLVDPCIVKYYGTADACSVNEPLDTITAKDRFGLVTTEKRGHRLDIKFRMLQPHELACAMSFPAGYKFSGTREAQVKQIGNAVPVCTSRALFRTIIADQYCRQRHLAA